MNTHNNRKRQMSKRLFHEALIELLQANHISEISITRLCETADLNRSTFYSMYKSEMDVLLEIEEETYGNVNSFIMSGIKPGDKTDSHLIFELFLKYIRDNPELFTVLLGQNGNMDFQQRLMEITDKANSIVFPDTKKDDSTAQYIRAYRVAGCTSLIERWIRMDFDKSLNEMVDLIIRLSAE